MAQHFKDGLDYAAAIFVVRMLEQVPSLIKFWGTKFWGTQTRWRLGVVLLLVMGGIAPHLYFRYSTYVGSVATEELGQNTAVASVDEVQVIKWLRAHAASKRLILSPPENAPWMATVPMHSFVSHWIFSLTYGEQLSLSRAFFDGSLSDAESDLLLTSYGIRYVLVPVGSPALRCLRKAELRWTGQKLLLYEFSQNEIKRFPKLEKLSHDHYTWKTE
jgi:hypothetical protein